MSLGGSIDSRRSIGQKITAVAIFGGNGTMQHSGTAAYKVRRDVK